MTRMRRAFFSAALAAAQIFAGGCSPAYVTQAVTGQLAIARARRPLAEVRTDPGTAPNLSQKLAAAADALEFAHGALALPDNGSYRQFADIGRPYAVWNVFVAPEFSLALRSWCFPVAGCVAYRGYFDEANARAFAAREARHGHDVAVRGALAYSTLGLFRDPLLSSVTRLPEVAVAGLIFHELAHQRLYVPDDTVFSESFATLVEQEGTIRWLEHTGDAEGLCAYLRGLEREREVHGLMRHARTRLVAIYASKAPDADRRAAKAAEFRRLRESYLALRDQWPGPPYFDAWFREPMSNASLGAIAAYQEHVGRLRVILEGEGGNLPSFYRRAERLARLHSADRVVVLREISRPSDRRPGAECRDGPG